MFRTGHVETVYKCSNTLASISRKPRQKAGLSGNIYEPFVDITGETGLSTLPRKNRLRFRFTIQPIIAFSTKAGHES